MKLLFSYDGRDESAKAFEFAIAHAKALNASLNIVNTVIRTSMDHTDDIKLAEKMLNKAKKICEEQGVECNTQVLIDKHGAGPAIVDYASQKEYDLIIVGIRKTSKVGKLLLGSNAQYVILNASCPVLTVGKEPLI